MSDLLETALGFFERGYPVIGVAENKKPYREWSDYLNKRKTQTESEVRAEFANGAWGLAGVLYPACNYVHLDFDGPHAEVAWETTGISLPETARFWTRSGYYHLVFLASDLLRKTPIRVKRGVRLVDADCDCTKDGKPKPCGVDLLLNGIAVLPGTPGYREDPDFPLESAVELPDEIIILRLAEQKEESATGGKTGDENGRIRNGTRNSTLISLAGSMRRRGMSYEAILAALLKDNQARCDPPLQESEVERIAKSAAGYEPAAENEKLTDIGNGRRFAKQHGDHVRYSHERSRWLIYTEKRWQWDVMGYAEALAKQTAATIYAEAMAEQDIDRRVDIAKHAISSERDARLRAMLHQAQSEPGIPVTIAQLDAYRYLFNAQNGIVDLKTGVLLPHDPRYLITQISPCNYDPDARCELFESVLRRAMNERESLVKFMQRLAGYCLTGDVNEQVVAFFHGLGANSKTKIIQGLLYVLGDYGATAAPGLLLAKRGESHPTELADLKGKRLVAAIEVREGRKFDEGMFKWLSGSDTIKARHMREDFFEFDPTHKLIIVANHKPTVSDTSLAFWRRLKMVPFDVTIPESEWDRDLLEKFKQEGDGILALMVSGCLQWQRDGLGAPEEVKQATESYRQDQDFLAPFLAECCDATEISDEEVTIGKLYDKFKSWAEENGEKAISRKRLSAMLKQRGYENYRSDEDKLYHWKRLRLRAL